MADKELLDKLETLVRALQSTKKKSDKTRLLLEARKDFDDEDDELMAFFRFLLDPSIVTGLSDAKINKHVSAKPDIDIQYLSCGYAYIMASCHNTGSDSAIATIQNYLHKNPKHEEFLMRLFTKNLPIGVEAATINKVYGEEIIPVWEVQQGYPIDKVKLKDGIWFSLSQKMNGNRGTMHRGELISRQAQKFKGLDHIKNDLLALYDGDASKRDSLVFDGELVYKNPEGMSDGQAFRYGTGLLNSDSKDKTGIKFVIFDVIPVVEFDRSKCTVPYRTRREWLNCLRAEIAHKHLENVEIVPMVYEGIDQGVISKWLDYAIEHDWEGLMLNTDVPYKRARHNGCLKIKRFYTVDLRVTAIEEGQNRLAGTMGALVVDYKGNELRIGSGFDDATRAAVWENPDDYIGKIVECKYKEVSCDKKTGAESLQFPTFVRFRNDKNEVSYG